MVYASTEFTRIRDDILLFYIKMELTTALDVITVDVSEVMSSIDRLKITTVRAQMVFRQLCTDV